MSNNMENNILIAEFMGLNIDRGVQSDYMEHELRYHESWDWLMPVLKKINEQISPNVKGLWRTITNPYEFSIEDVYKQVVKFINQYNNNDESKSK